VSGKVKHTGKAKNGCAFSGCGALLFFFVAIVTLVPFSVSCTGGRNEDGQAHLQASIVNDRKKLFSGELAYLPYALGKVGDSFTYEVELTAIGENKSSNWPPDYDQGTPWPVPQLRKFQVGGVQGATLSTGSSGVKIIPLADSQTEQVIAEPGDTARWMWKITAEEPGDHELLLTVVTYQGNSNRALATLNPPIRVFLTVEDTVSHRFETMKGFLIAFGVVSGGVITTLLGVFTFRTQLIEFTREKRTQWQERRRDSQSNDKSGYL
jgi:hypothetical protein